MHSAVLAVSARPQLLDRQGQPGRAIGDDQARGGESAGAEVAAELEPVLLGLARARTHRNQRPCAVFGESPRAHDAFLGAAGADRQVDRIEEQHHQLDLVQIAARELREALMQLGADPGHGRFRRAPEPSLLTQRLDVTHREAANERADDHRLERVGT
jgi:hypothetical protein